MILLHEHMGGAWQGDISVRKPSKLYIPRFGQRVGSCSNLTVPRSSRLNRAKAFDKMQWDQIGKEIEDSVLKGPSGIGREYSFSGRRVIGSWRGQRSGVQILPPPRDLPSVPTESGDHPFILEFPLMRPHLDLLTNHTRLRKHRDLMLLRNILLVGGVKGMGRSTHCWAGTEWAQQWFSPTLNQYITDALSVPATTQLEELKPEECEKMLAMMEWDFVSLLI